MTLDITGAADLNAFAPGIWDPNSGTPAPDTFTLIAPIPPHVTQQGLPYPPVAPKGLVVWNPHAAPDEMALEGLPWSFSHTPGEYVAGYVPRYVPLATATLPLRRVLPLRGGAYAAGTIFDDIGDALSDAGDWVKGAVETAVSAIKSVPGLGFIVEQVEDFSKTAVGRIFFAAMGPGILTEFFTAIPGIGLQIASSLSTLGPVATQMLPGLVKGERVDRVFVESLKDVVSRAGAAGGADVANQYMKDGLSAISNALQGEGINPAELAAKADQARRDAGLTTVDQVLPPEAQKRLDASLKPLLDKMTSKLPSLSKSTGIPLDVLQVALDGMTRTTGYDPRNYDRKTGAARDFAAEEKAGKEKQARERAAYVASVRASEDFSLQNSIDSFILTKLGTTAVYATNSAECRTLGFPLGACWIQQGGRFRTIAEIISEVHNPKLGYSGKGALITPATIADRVHYYAKLNRRPDEAWHESAAEMKNRATALLQEAVITQTQALAYPPTSPQFALAMQKFAQIQGAAALLMNAGLKQEAADIAQGRQASPPLPEPSTIAEMDARALLLLDQASKEEDPTIALQKRTKAADYATRANALRAQLSANVAHPAAAALQDKAVDLLRSGQISTAIEASQSPAPFPQTLPGWLSLYLRPTG